jgi:Raf kinase inhibitor-like YbhB/YbcL family protein
MRGPGRSSSRKFSEKGSAIDRGADVRRPAQSHFGASGMNLKNCGLLLLVMTTFLLLPLSRAVCEGAQKGAFKVSSAAFANNAYIPRKYTCDGPDVNPPLKIEHVSPAARSLVLIVDDPDAPAGVWVHWVIWNIDPSVTDIPENSVPDGAIEGVNDFRRQGYGGPCPPAVHRYFFKLYALDTVLSLDSRATKASVEKAMQGHIISQTLLIGIYGRK